jgi:hypothetical protein
LKARLLREALRPFDDSSVLYLKKQLWMIQWEGGQLRDELSAEEQGILDGLSLVSQAELLREALSPWNAKPMAYLKARLSTVARDLTPSQ